MTWTRYTTKHWAGASRNPTRTQPEQNPNPASPPLYPVKGRGTSTPDIATYGIARADIERDETRVGVYVWYPDTRPNGAMGRPNGVMGADAGVAR